MYVCTYIHTHTCNVIYCVYNSVMVDLVCVCARAFNLRDL